MIGLIVALIILAVVLWAVETLIPIDATLKKLIYVVAVICVLLYILRFFAFV